MIDLTKSPDKIRASILQAAMSGQLTQQLPEDGTAEDLIKEIDNEKKRLIEEGKIKKQKELPDIENDEILFSIPSNWKWIRLGDICSINSGLSYKKNDLSDNENDLRVIRGGNISNNFELVLKNDDYRIPSSLVKNNDIILKENQIITPVSTSPKHTGKMALVPSLNEKVLAGGFVYQITPIIIKRVISKFIMFALSCPETRKKIKSITNLSGSALANIPKAKFTKVVLPFPPLAEQQRIVDKLDELLPKVSALKENTDKLEQLRKNFPNKIRQSLLQSAMKGDLTDQLPEDGSAEDLLKEIDDEKKRLIEEGKIKKQKALPDIEDDEIPFEIPSNWKWVRLGNINNIVMGQSPKGKDVFEGSPNSENYEFHQGKTFFSDKVIFPSNKVTKSDARLINSNYIIMSVRAPVGDVNQLDRTIYIGRGLCGICPYKYRKDFLYYYLSSQKSNLMRKSTGSTFKAINKATVFNHLIPLPPLNEQKRIVEKLDELFSKLDD